MRRVYLLAAGAGVAVLVALWLNWRLATVQSADPEPESTVNGQKTQLPIGQIVLFSSGVGYFQREGTVEGNARVDLSFPVRVCSKRGYLRIIMYEPQTIPIRLNRRPMDNPGTFDSPGPTGGSAPENQDA